MGEKLEGEGEPDESLRMEVLATRQAFHINKELKLDDQTSGR